MLPAINGIVAGKRKADFGSKERKPDRRAPGGSCLIATRRNSPNQAVASAHIHGGSRPEQGSGSRISSESSTPRWRSAAGFPRLLTKLERVGLAGRDLAQVGQELDPARVLVRCQSRLHVGLRSEEHTSELQSRRDLVCRLLLEKKKNSTIITSL